MKITKQQLKQVIKEELSRALSEGDESKILDYFIFDGNNSSATMKDGATIPADPRAERRRTYSNAPPKLKMANPEGGQLRRWVDNNMTTLGYESKLERMISPDPEKKLYPEDLKASVLMRFPDGEERKYNSETGPDGERF